ncbi:glycosyltransferase family 4 protein [Leptolyngbya sp. AN02str]|uniref:glycosyltransferase family 4 protein n=1 Tax=Leptolyngbya sp. AN02str TaxID=3423363 RepID=UPI003D31B5A7
MKVAVVHEWLVTYAGSEKVCEQLLLMFPEAELYSLVEFLDDELRFFLHERSPRTSFLQHLPFAKRHFRAYLPLMPLAIEQFDLSDYDLVLSSHHAVTKGVITRPDQLHISYVHTPMRYAWEMQQQYLQGANLKRGIRAIAASAILHYLRMWDVATANRVDHYLANSRFVAQRIWKTYRRKATVVYPPVAIDRFQARSVRDDFYLTISRFVPYKRVDLTVQAFTRLGLPLVVIGDGPTREQVTSQGSSNVVFLAPQSDAVIEDYLQRCKAFVYPAEEDFGITLVEAQAAGAPVIAYGKGGAAETVISGKTGILFNEQTVDSMVSAIQQFEDGQFTFQLEDLRQQAERFSPDRFRQELSQLIDQKFAQFRAGDAIH